MYRSPHNSYTLKSTCQLGKEQGRVYLFFRKKSNFILVQQPLKDNDYVIVNKKPWFKKYSKDDFMKTKVYQVHKQHPAASIS